MAEKVDIKVFEKVLPRVLEIVRTSSSLSAKDVDFYKSLDNNLSGKIDMSAKNLLLIINQLIRCCPDFEKEITFGKQNVSSKLSWKPIRNTLDNVFEKIDFVIDRMNKDEPGKENTSKSSNMIYLEDTKGFNEVSRNSSKTMYKPQLNFKNKIDNSEEKPFTPKLHFKPNALVSFEDSVQLIIPKENRESNDELPYYPQPYEYEIDNQPYPECILTKRDPIDPNSWSDTSAIWVDNVEELKKMIDCLSRLKEIAVDLEHHDYRSYYGLVCLMQISNREYDWLIDTLALRDDLEILNNIFTNPTIVKVFHGAFMDIIWLQRDLGLYVVSLFDTYHAAKKLGLQKFSLAFLLENYASFKTTKKYQLSDWRTRPLLRAMVAYARSDTHFLLNIYDQLRNMLVEAGDGKLLEVLYESRQVAKRRFEFTKFRPLASSNLVSCPIMATNPKEPYLLIMSQFNVPYHKKPVVEVLYQWRDKVAKRDDESVRYVVPNHVLVALALLEQPVNAEKVLNVCQYVPEYVRCNADELALLISNKLDQIAENDWELVNQWSSSSHIPSGESHQKKDASEIDDVSSYLFDMILSASKLDTNSSLLDDFPKLSSLRTDTQGFSFEYMDEGLKTNFLYDTFPERFKFLRKNLLAQEDIFGLLHVAANEESPSENTKENLNLTNNSRDSNTSETQKDEIIVLQRKNRRSHKVKDASSEKPLDYDNNEKILIDTNQLKSHDSKKRSISPYNKASEAPQGAKRKKRLIKGRSQTFKN